MGDDTGLKGSRDELSGFNKSRGLLVQEKKSVAFFEFAYSMHIMALFITLQNCGVDHTSPLFFFFS